MSVTQTVQPKVSRWNRQTYQRLKLALSLGLRRQIFVAVCDDLSLRNRLATRLHAELGVGRLVNLKLNISKPSLSAQIANWEKLHGSGPNAAIGQPRGAAPTFQILGIELLTRQPPSVQRLFLRHLQATPRSLPGVDYSLLLWLPQPWFYTIEQSAPDFWRWHTGVFEFEGEPTPVPLVSPESEVWSPESRITSSYSQNSNSQPYTGAPSQNALEDSRLAETAATKIPDLDTPDTNKQDATPSWLAHSGGSLEDELSILMSALLSDDEQLEQQSNSSTGVSASIAALEGLAALSSPSESPTAEEQAIANEKPRKQPSYEELEFNELDFEASPLEAYLRLGNYYRDRIEQGEVSQEFLNIAIQAYEQAIANWPSDVDAQDSGSFHSLSDVLNDLGNLYWMLSRIPGGQSPHAAPTDTGEEGDLPLQKTLSYLEQAIQAYQLALTKIVADASPYTYAMIQNNLGAAYGDRARFSDPAFNHQQSIRAYQEALRYRRADLDSLKYASTQNNLGTAYWHLAQHQEPITNLNQAIAAYTEALSYYDQERDPLNWAMIQNNLGTTYWNLAQYEQPTAFLQMAVDAYQNALKYRTPDVVPAASAATLNNLGTAYWYLASQVETLPPPPAEVRMEYLQTCIAAYETAIALAWDLANSTPPVPVNFDVLATGNNLGLAHYQLATDPQFDLAQDDKSAHLEAALHHHLQALQGFVHQPDNYQTAFSYVIRTIRAFYRQCGLQGQNLALSKVPGHLLPQILPRL